MILKLQQKKRKYFSAAAAEFEVLKKKISHDKNADLQKFKDEITELLENEIVSRYYYQSGQIEASFKNDLEIKKATAALKDKDVYSSILKNSMASAREKH
jgi:carboxyl-terminal processing protease